MCSVFDFIDKQKYFIRSKHKTIETLYGFLDSIDNKPKDERIESKGVKKQFNSKPNKSNGDKNGNYVSNQKIGYKTNDLMIGRNGFLSWIDSQQSQQKQRQLAEERRRDYNEFLQQKSKLETQNSRRSSKRVTQLIPDYNDILKTKRIEEQKYRQSNGFDAENIGFMDRLGEEETPITKSELPQLGWAHCSNNKFVNGFITPRSRLLATHSSRIKAAKYREELRKQVEEKDRIKAEERERLRLEDEEFENKLEAQRLKLLKEFEEEHRFQHLKDNQNSSEDQMSKQITNKDLMMDSTSPLSLLRSPTYMYMKDTQPLNPLPRKSSAVSRSLASAMSETTRNRQSMATQTSVEQKPYPVMTSEESSECDSSLSSEEDDTEEDEDKVKETEFRRRVLSQLSDVRQMMESDHIKMMEQLRLQQLSQLDE